MQTKQNSMIDLIWIIPEIIGELFLTVYIPVMLVKELNIVGPLTTIGILYIAVIFLLMTNMRLNGLYELSKIKKNQHI